MLGQPFWQKLSQISNSVGLTPEDLLAVMFFESAGLDPAAHNPNGNASGLIQFMPNTLRDVGYKGTPEDFRQESAERQLDFISRYVLDHSRAVNGHFKSAAQYYVANLWPIALKLPGVQQEDSRTVILEKNPAGGRYPGISAKQEAAAYNANQSLDVDKDGKISYGDLEKVMQNIKRSSRFRQAVETLSSGQELAVGKSTSSPKSQAKPVDNLTQIETMLESLWKAVAEEEGSLHFQQKCAYKDLLPNHLLIKIASDSLDTSLEFSRILCLALDEELFSDGIIHTDKENVQVSCTVYGPKQLSINATLQLCEVLSETFEAATIKIGSKRVRIEICPNQEADYQELDIKTGRMNFDRFHLQFIEGK